MTVCGVRPVTGSCPAVAGSQSEDTNFVARTARSFRVILDSTFEVLEAAESSRKSWPELQTEPEGVSVFDRFTVSSKKPKIPNLSKGVIASKIQKSEFTRLLVNAAERLNPKRGFGYY